MEYLEFKKLLEKFRKQECSKEELKFFWEWISDVNNEHLVKLALNEELEKFSNKKVSSGDENFDILLNKIESGMQFSDTKSTIWFRKGVVYFARIAAIVIITFMLGAVFSYFLLSPEPKSEVAYCEIKTPLGAKSEVTLPDGTTIWMNAGSKIRYQNLFNKTNRNVFLEGEAYFKVSKNENLPFVVKTNGLDIVAVGTEFNVKAYNDEGTIETTLLEGKVEIINNRIDSVKKGNPIYLLPKQMAVYSKNQQKLETRNSEKSPKLALQETIPQKAEVIIDANIDPAPIISWKENKLIIKGEELGALAIKLERKYNISFKFKCDDIKHFRFSGTLEDETITQVLDVIKLTAPIDYKLEGKTVEIYENSQMTQRFRNHLTRKQTF